MAFIDNSGDIVLDVVLTDTGRARLAKGDGSFKIVKFAFGDDEINYELFDASHASGSAYFDLQILQTPVFEAFTNNTSNMKSRLITLNNNNLLYLPVMKLNSSVGSQYQTTNGTTFLGSGSHVLVVDEDTNTAIKNVVSSMQGFLNGISPQSNGNMIRVDQGLDTSEISAEFAIDPELKETQYIVELDHRFAKIYDPADKRVASPSYIDDDMVASYYFAQNVGGFVKNSVPGALTGNNVNSNAVAEFETIVGPRGTNLRFGLLASTDVVASDYLFTLLGQTVTHGAEQYRYIDTNVRVVGVTTGYQLDIPLRIAKLV